MSQSGEINLMKAAIVLLLALTVFFAWSWYGAEGRVNLCLYQHLMDVHQWLRHPAFGIEGWDTEQKWEQGQEEIRNRFAQWEIPEKESVFGDGHKIYGLMIDISQVSWADANREAIVKKYMELTLSSHVNPGRNQSQVIIENDDVYRELLELLGESR